MKPVPFSNRVEAINCRTMDAAGLWNDFTVSSFMHEQIQTYTRIRATSAEDRERAPW